MDNPLVSILVPCYNHEKYIDDCIQSICMQSYKNIEVLIIDDCSTDNSFKIVKTWEEKLKKCVSYVYIEQNKENLGIVKNLNKLISLCNGEYIKCIASDDILSPDAIFDLVSFALGHNADLIFSNAYIIDGNTHLRTLSSQSFKLKNSSIPRSGKGLTRYLCAKCYICAPTVLIPRKTIEKYGKYDETLLIEDWEYWLRVSIDGSIEYLDKPTVYYRVAAGSLSHYSLNDSGRKKHRVFHDEKVKIFNRYKKYCLEEDLSRFYNDELSEAIALYDNELVKKIHKDMKKDNVEVTGKNALKYILLRIKIYPILKRFLKRNSFF